MLSTVIKFTIPTKNLMNKQCDEQDSPSAMGIQDIGDGLNLKS